MYGTVDAQGDGHPIAAQGAYGPRAELWRSTDHGHTWNAVYEGPGVRMAVLDSSPADPSSVYVSVDAPDQPNRFLVERRKHAMKYYFILRINTIAYFIEFHLGYSSI